MENLFSLLILPGGSLEILEAQPHVDEQVLVLERRKGFIELALKYGIPLVPVYSFGATELYDQVRPLVNAHTRTPIAAHALNRTTHTHMTVELGQVVARVDDPSPSVRADDRLGHVAVEAAAGQVPGLRGRGRAGDGGPRAQDRKSVV